ncbi:MAG: helix-turn-helix transcriptional regulator, partial [Clostridiales bacterium]|nr:helix-turn-helix transcriptional regulator [Clostridiales bacterium]
MLVYHFPIQTPLKYSRTGKFKSPSQNWIHQEIELLDYELIVMSEGVLYLSYLDKEYVVSPGEFLLLPPSQDPRNNPNVSPSHYRKGFKPSECSFYWLHFSCESASGNEAKEVFLSPDLLVNQEHSIYIPTQKELPFPEKLLVLMRQLQDYERSYYGALSLNYLTTTILCEVFHQCFWKIHQAPSEGVSDRQKQLINDIVDYIQANIYVDLKVSHIARDFQYNEKYLSTLLHKHLGIPPKQYIMKLKMEEANFLLTDTNLPIGTR